MTPSRGPRPGAGIPTSAGSATGSTAAAGAVAPKPSGLTLNKIIAGAAAAATTAVAGSFFGAAGTVLGAALGSMVSTLATAIYQRSLDRTREVLRARIRLPSGRSVDVTSRLDVPFPAVAAGRGEPGPARAYLGPAGSANRPTTEQSPVLPARPRPRWAALIAITVGMFLVGLLAVTGIELLKGSTLTRSEAGTSVGRVVDPPPVPVTTGPVEPGRAATTRTAEPTGTTATTRTIEPTAEATATRSATEEPDGDNRSATDIPEDGSTSGEADPETTPSTTPTPTPDANSATDR